MKKNSSKKSQWPCLRNAKQYIKDGEILCSFRSYGHALAMIILCNVEMGKAAIYNLCAKDLIPKTALPQPYSTQLQKKRIRKICDRILVDWFSSFFKH
ncbi:hypothetical protein MUO66_05355 [Candidatus Bathyarchaeota archaeon]|nr:hypothetical protein [Candidatus Bathyarchaeota archaeon]